MKHLLNITGTLEAPTYKYLLGAVHMYMHSTSLAARGDTGVPASKQVHILVNNYY